jgi:hypothetical protein
MDKKTSLKAALVTCNDAASIDSWEDLDDAEKHTPSIIQTLGFIVNDCEDHIIMACNWDTSSDRVSGHIVIPKPWVLSFYEFEPHSYGAV